jgi:hypothetical protein
MARFTANISGPTLTVTDTASTNDVLAMPAAEVHGMGLGSAPNLAPALTIVEVDEPFGTPYGEEREMGIDFIFDFDNSTGTVAKQIGSFGLKGFNLVEPVDLWTLIGSGFTQVPADPNYHTYPGDHYSPITLIRDRVNANFPYNICVSLAYPVDVYDHLLVSWCPPRDDSNGPVLGGVPKEIRYHACNKQPFDSSSEWATIPAGARRRYILQLRINDRTNTPVGPAPDAVGNEIWTLRGYQRYFRARHGKADYRRMGGWDGRAVQARFLAPDGTYDPANERRWNSTFSDPTTGTGYAKIADDLLARRVTNNVERCMIWALSGYHKPGTPPVYPFRFATGVLNSTRQRPGVSSPH